MFWRRTEGGKYRYGFNFQIKDGNTIFALNLVVPVFILPTMLYEDWETAQYLYGHRVLVVGVGIRFRRRAVSRSVNDMAYFRYAWWTKPIGDTRFIANVADVEDGIA